MPAKVHPYFGAKLRFWRCIRGFGSKDLGRRALISESLVSHYESGKTNPSYDTACKLAEVLGVPIEYLWDHQPPPAFSVPEPDPRRTRDRRSGFIEALDTGKTDG